MNPGRILWRSVLVVLLASAVGLGWAVWRPAWRWSVFRDLLRDDPDRRARVAGRVLDMGTDGVEEVLRLLGNGSQAERRASAALLFTISTDKKIQKEAPWFDGYATGAGRDRLRHVLMTAVMDEDDRVAALASDTLYAFLVRFDRRFMEEKRDRDRIAACASDAGGDERIGFPTVADAGPGDDPRPEDLTTALRSESVPVRLQAMWAIERYRFRGPDVIRLAIEAGMDRRDEARKVRLAVVRFLGDVAGSPESEKALADRLGDVDPRVAMEAARALAIVGGRDAVPALVKVLARPGPEALRREALRALRLIADRDLGPEPAAWERWWTGACAGFDPVAARRRALRDADPDVAATAATALGRAGVRDASAALIEELADPSPRVRAAAAEALGVLESGEAIDPGLGHSGLLDLLSDPDQAVRIAADLALTRITGQAFAFTTRRRYRVEEAQPEARAEAARAWRSWYARNKIRSRGEWLVDALSQQAPADMRIAALKDLGRSATSAAVAFPKILPLLKDEDPRVRQAALDAIEGLGVSPHVRLDEVTRVLTEDSDEAVRVRAGRVLLARQGQGAAATFIRILSTREDEGSDAVVETIKSLTVEDLERFGVLGTRDAPGFIEEISARIDPKRSDASVRKRMIQALGNLAHGLHGRIRDDKARGAVDPRLESDPMALSAQAILDALRTFGIPGLIQGLLDDEEPVRFWAIEALKRVIDQDDDRGYDYHKRPAENADAIRRWEEANVVRDLASGDEEMRMRGLRRIEENVRRNGEILPTSQIVRLILSDPSDRVRHAAALTVMRAGGREVAPPLAAAVIQAALDGDPRAYSAVIDAVRDLGWVSIIPLLDDGLKRSDPSYVVACARVLGDIGLADGRKGAIEAKIKPAVQTLFRTLTHSRREVRVATRVALGQILGAASGSGYSPDLDPDSIQRAADRWREETRGWWEQ